MKKSMTAYMEVPNGLETERFQKTIVNGIIEKTRHIKRTIAEWTRYKKRMSNMTRWCSLIIGEPLTTGEVLRALHASIASMALLFPADMPLLLRICFLIWTLIALIKCKR